MASPGFKQILDSETNHKIMVKLQAGYDVI
jgi:hypothetical protein